MIEARAGEIAALFTAMFWTITAMSFEAAGKRIGSLAVNFLRLVLGIGFLSIFVFFSRGLLFPVDATTHQWLWLSISGIIGVVIGDHCLFQAFVLIGSRVSMLIMATVPPITALVGWLLMGEHLTYLDFFAMGLTMAGIASVVLERNPGKNQVRLSHPIKGILLALGGALGQAIGLVFSKYGMGDYNAFAATQIRLLAGILGFSILFFFLKAWPQVVVGVKNKKGLLFTSVGAFFGPFLGIAFSLLAVQNTATGIASTIMAIVPVLIIPPAVIFFKEKVTVKEIIGAIIAVAGVALLFR
jgi:drug/metabolite transporter (DMT)-like permease